MDMATMLAGLLRNLGVRPEMFAQIGATVAQADAKLDEIIEQNNRLREQNDRMLELLDSMSHVVNGGAPVQPILQNDGGEWRRAETLRIGEHFDMVTDRPIDPPMKVIGNGR